MGPYYANLISAAIIMCNTVLSCKTSRPKGLDCCRWSDFGSLFPPNGGTTHSCSCQQSGADPKWWIVHFWGLPYIILILQHIAAGCAHNKKFYKLPDLSSFWPQNMNISSMSDERQCSECQWGLCLNLGLFACSVKESGKAWDLQDVVRK